MPAPATSLAAGGRWVRAASVPAASRRRAPVSAGSVEGPSREGDGVEGVEAPGHTSRRRRPQARIERGDAARSRAARGPRRCRAARQRARAQLVACWVAESTLPPHCVRTPARTSRGRARHRPASPARPCAARPAGRPQRARPARTSPRLACADVGRLVGARARLLPVSLRSLAVALRDWNTCDRLSRWFPAIHARSRSPCRILLTGYPCL